MPIDFPIFLAINRANCIDEIVKTNTKFNFEVSFSKDYYRQKPSGIDYARMKWTKRNVSVQTFANLIMQGYSYCHIYFNNLRRKDKFLHTNIVSIDVDDTDVCLAEFIDSIQLKPTFAYETFSNGIDGKYSYRLIYVTEEKMNRKCFTQIYEKICRMTGLENTKDHCGKVLTQLMNGTRPDAYQYRSNIIYSNIHDLPVPAIEEPSDIWDCTQKISLKPVELPFDFDNDYYNIDTCWMN